MHPLVFRLRKNSRLNSGLGPLLLVQLVTLPATSSAIFMGGIAYRQADFWFGNGFQFYFSTDKASAATGGTTSRCPSVAHLSHVTNTYWALRRSVPYTTNKRASQPASSIPCSKENGCNSTKGGWNANGSGRQWSNTVKWRTSKAQSKINGFRVNGFSAPAVLRSLCRSCYYDQRMRRRSHDTSGRPGAWVGAEEKDERRKK